MEPIPLVLILDHATLLTLVLALVVFFNRPQHLISRLLLLYGVFPLAERIASIPTNGYADVRLADYFYVGAYWPAVLLSNLFSFSFATLMLMLLVFPHRKLPMRRHPRLASASRLCATTPATSSTSYRSPTAPKRSFERGMRGWVVRDWWIADCSLAPLQRHDARRQSPTPCLLRSRG